jgi:predicted transcriptional regulator
VVRQKRSISLSEELSDRVDAAAEAEGTTPSAWLAEAAQRRLAIEEGIAAMDEWFEAAGGPPTDDETAWATAALDRIMKS